MASGKITDLLDTAFTSVGVYSVGVPLTLKTRHDFLEKDGVQYSVAPATALPFTTTGNWAADAASLFSFLEGPLRGQLAETANPQHGVGLMPSAIRTVGTVAEMVAMAGWSAGQRVQTLGYYVAGDGGANVYTVIAKGVLVVDGGRYIAASDPTLLFRGEFVDGCVRIMQFGTLYGGFDDTIPYMAAVVYARTIGFAPVILKASTTKLRIDGYAPADNDIVIGPGKDRASIKFNPGTHGFRLSSKAVGVVFDRVDFTRSVKLHGFSIDATDVDFGIYANGCLFLDIDDVVSFNAKVCNAFFAYCFRCDIGYLDVGYGLGAGFEFAYNRFGWADIIPGEPAAICHGNTIKRIASYANGAGLVARPDTAGGSGAGAGCIFGPGFGNDVGLVYCELNKGSGVVIVAGMSYTLGTIYLEKNDDLALVTDTRTELYTASNEAAIGDVFTQYAGLRAIINNANLVIQSHRGVSIRGTGYTKVSGLCRGSDMLTPRVIPLLIFTVRGAKDFLTDIFTLPTGLPPESSQQFAHSGAYRMYPEVTCEVAGTVTAGPNVRIFKLSDPGSSVYNRTVAMSGAVAAGTRVKLPYLDFAWDPAETYRIQFYGLDGYGSGKISVNLYAEVMV